MHDVRKTKTICPFWCTKRKTGRTHTHISMLSIDKIYLQNLYTHHKNDFCDALVYGKVAALMTNVATFKSLF